MDLTKTTIIQNAWSQRNEPKVHGWVYSLKTGLIKDLGVSFDNSAKLPPIYRVNGDNHKLTTTAQVEAKEA
jgi:carbonic anhydrase